MLWARANLRPLLLYKLFIFLGQKWSQICCSSKHMEVLLNCGVLYNAVSYSARALGRAQSEPIIGQIHIGSICFSYALMMFDYHNVWQKNAWGGVGNLLDKHAVIEGEMVGRSKGWMLALRADSSLVGLSDYYGFRLLVCFGLSLCLLKSAKLDCFSVSCSN